MSSRTPRSAAGSPTGHDDIYDDSFDFISPRSILDLVSNPVREGLGSGLSSGHSQLVARSTEFPSGNYAELTLGDPAARPPREMPQIGRVMTSIHEKRLKGLTVVEDLMRPNPPPAPTHRHTGSLLVADKPIHRRQVSFAINNSFPSTMPTSRTTSTTSSSDRPPAASAAAATGGVVQPIDPNSSDASVDKENGVGSHRRGVAIDNMIRMIHTISSLKRWRNKSMYSVDRSLDNLRESATVFMTQTNPIEFGDMISQALTLSSDSQLAMKNSRLEREAIGISPHVNLLQSETNMYRQGDLAHYTTVKYLQRISNSFNVTLLGLVKKYFDTCTLQNGLVNKSSYVHLLLLIHKQLMPMTPGIDAVKLALDDWSKDSVRWGIAIPRVTGSNILSPTTTTMMMPPQTPTSSASATLASSSPPISPRATPKKTPRRNSNEGPLSTPQHQQQQQQPPEDELGFNLAGFHSAIFQLVDHWTLTCDASEYVAFLENMYAKLTQPNMDYTPTGRTPTTNPSTTSTNGSLIDRRKYIWKNLTVEYQKGLESLQRSSAAHDKKRSGRSTKSQKGGGTTNGPSSTTNTPGGKVQQSEEERSSKMATVEAFLQAQGIEAPPPIPTFSEDSKSRIRSAGSTRSSARSSASNTRRATPTSSNIVVPFPTLTNLVKDDPSNHGTSIPSATTQTDPNTKVLEMKIDTGGGGDEEYVPSDDDDDNDDSRPGFKRLLSSDEPLSPSSLTHQQDLERRRKILEEKKRIFEEGQLAKNMTTTTTTETKTATSLVESNTTSIASSSTSKPDSNLTVVSLDIPDDHVIPPSNPALPSSISSTKKKRGSIAPNVSTPAASGASPTKPPIRSALMADMHELLSHAAKGVDEETSSTGHGGKSKKKKKKVNGTSTATTAAANTARLGAAKKRVPNKKGRTRSNSRPSTPPPAAAGSVGTSPNPTDPLVKVPSGAVVDPDHSLLHLPAVPPGPNFRTSEGVVNYSVLPSEIARLVRPRLGPQASVLRTPMEEEHIIANEMKRIDEDQTIKGSKAAIERETKLKLDKRRNMLRAHEWMTKEEEGGKDTHDPSVTTSNDPLTESEQIARERREIEDAEYAQRMAQGTNRRPGSNNGSQASSKRSSGTMSIILASTRPNSREVQPTSDAASTTRSVDPTVPETSIVSSESPLDGSASAVAASVEVDSATLPTPVAVVGGHQRASSTTIEFDSSTGLAAPTRSQVIDKKTTRKAVGGGFQKKNGAMTLAPTTTTTTPVRSRKPSVDFNQIDPITLNKDRKGTKPKMNPTKSKTKKAPTGDSIADDTTGIAATDTAPSAEVAALAAAQATANDAWLDQMTRIGNDPQLVTAIERVNQAAASAEQILDAAGIAAPDKSALPDSVVEEVSQLTGDGASAPGLVIASVDGSVDVARAVESMAATIASEVETVVDESLKQQKSRTPSIDLEAITSAAAATLPTNNSRRSSIRRLSIGSLRNSRRGSPAPSHSPRNSSSARRSNNSSPTAATGGRGRSSRVPASRRSNSTFSQPSQPRLVGFGGSRSETPTRSGPNGSLRASRRSTAPKPTTNTMQRFDENSFILPPSAIDTIESQPMQAHVKVDVQPQSFPPPEVIPSAKLIGDEPAPPPSSTVDDSTIPDESDEVSVDEEDDESDGDDDVDGDVDGDADGDDVVDLDEGGELVMMKDEDYDTSHSTTAAGSRVRSAARSTRSVSKNASRSMTPDVMRAGELIENGNNQTVSNPAASIGADDDEHQTTMPDDWMKQVDDFFREEEEGRAGRTIDAANRNAQPPIVVPNGASSSSSGRHQARFPAPASARPPAGVTARPHPMSKVAGQTTLRGWDDDTTNKGTLQTGEPIRVESTTPIDLTLRSRPSSSMRAQPNAPLHTNVPPSSSSTLSESPSSLLDSAVTATRHALHALSSSAGGGGGGVGGGSLPLAVSREILSAIRKLEPVESLPVQPVLRPPSAIKTQINQQQQRSYRNGREDDGMTGHDPTTVSLNELNDLNLSLSLLSLPTGRKTLQVGRASFGTKSSPPPTHHSSTQVRPLKLNQPTTIPPTLQEANDSKHILKMNLDIVARQLEATKDGGSRPPTGHKEILHAIHDYATVDGKDRTRSVSPHRGDSRRASVSPTRRAIGPLQGPKHPAPGDSSYLPPSPIGANSFTQPSYGTNHVPTTTSNNAVTPAPFSNLSVFATTAASIPNPTTPSHGQTVHLSSGEMIRGWNTDEHGGDDDDETIATNMSTTNVPTSTYRGSSRTSQRPSKPQSRGVRSVTPAASASSTNALPTPDLPIAPTIPNKLQSPVPPSSAPSSAPHAPFDVAKAVSDVFSKRNTASSPARVEPTQRAPANVPEPTSGWSHALTFADDFEWHMSEHQRFSRAGMNAGRSSNGRRRRRRRTFDSSSEDAAAGGGSFMPLKKLTGRFSPVSYSRALRQVVDESRRNMTKSADHDLDPPSMTTRPISTDGVRSLRSSREPSPSERRRGRQGQVNNDNNPNSVFMDTDGSITGWIERRTDGPADTNGYEEKQSSSIDSNTRPSSRTMMMMLANGGLEHVALSVASSPITGSPQYVSPYLPAATSVTAAGLAAGAGAGGKVPSFPYEVHSARFAALTASYNSHPNTLVPLTSVRPKTAERWEKSQTQHRPTSNGTGVNTRGQYVSGSRTERGTSSSSSSSRSSSRVGRANGANGGGKSISATEVHSISVPLTMPVYQPPPPVTHPYAPRIARPTSTPNATAGGAPSASASVPSIPRARFDLLASDGTPSNQPIGIGSPTLAMQQRELAAWAHATARHTALHHSHWNVAASSAPPPATPSSPVGFHPAAPEHARFRYDHTAHYLHASGGNVTSVGPPSHSHPHPPPHVAAPHHHPLGTRETEHTYPTANVSLGMNRFGTPSMHTAGSDIQLTTTTPTTNPATSLTARAHKHIAASASSAARAAAGSQTARAPTKGSSGGHADIGVSVVKPTYRTTHK